MSSLLRKWWLYPLVVLALIVVVLSVFSSSEEGDISLNQFLDDVQAGRVTRIEVDGTRVEYEVAGVDGRFRTRIEDGDSIREILADNGINPGSATFPTIVADQSGFFPLFIRVIFQLLPLILIIGIIAFFYRQATQANRRGLSSMLVTNFDPVCRASVNPGSAAGSSTFMSTTYYFCSAEHKEQFDSNPQKYLLQK